MARPFFERVERVIRRILESLAVALLASIAIVCFVEVVLRYGLGRSFGWYDEFTGYMLVWLTFFGAVLAQQEDRHIGIENLIEGLGPGGRRLSRLIVHAILVILHLLLLYYGGVLAVRFLSERAITLPVPMGVIYLVIPVSAVLMLFVQLVQVGRLLQTKTD